MKIVSNRMKAVIVSLILLMPVLASGKDFGKMGKTWEVEEEGFTMMMKRKLSEIDVKRHQEEMARVARKRINEPKPLAGISKATESRRFYHDPSYILAEDVRLPCGKLLYKAGTSVNPLEHMQLERRLIFINGSDEEQIEWLKELLGQKKGNVSGVEDRVILTGGSVFKVKDSLGRVHGDKVYFDQHGELTGKFGIKAVPAILEQGGLLLRIDEIILNEER